MITNTEPMMAVYHSDVHCVACAEEKFGSALYSRDGATDDHDEKVSIIYDWDYSPRPAEEDSGEYCGTCHHEITEASPEYQKAQAIERAAYTIENLPIPYAAGTAGARAWGQAIIRILTELAKELEEIES